MANVILERVSKQYPGGQLAVDDVSLEIDDREFLVLVGPSGCGKSTTLRLMAGLETCTSGEVKIGGRVVTHTPPKDRDIAMVFQNYALYPHMSVYKNLSFGLTLRYGGGVISRGLRKIVHPQRAAELNRLRAGIDEKVRQTASRLGIEHLLDRKPHQLSGGERQRVALGRAIVRNPAAFLFDEPLSNLDAKLRQQMRTELKRLHRDLQATMIYVTHDQIEAMTLGDRVAVMNDGKILQVGKPLEIYQRPANLFVAKFVGSVPINLCAGTVKQTKDWIEFRGGFDCRWANDSPVFRELSQVLNREAPEREVVLGFRAEDVFLSDGPKAIKAQVTQLDHLGESTMVHAQLVAGSDEDQHEKTDTTSASLLARISPSSNLQPGQRIGLEIVPDKTMWFDPNTGENLLKDKK